MFLKWLFETAARDCATFFKQKSSLDCGQGQKSPSKSSTHSDVQRHLSCFLPGMAPTRNLQSLCTASCCFPGGRECEQRMLASNGENFHICQSVWDTDGSMYGSDRFFPHSRQWLSHIESGYPTGPRSEPNEPMESKIPK